MSADWLTVVRSVSRVLLIVTIAPHDFCQWQSHKWIEGKVRHIESDQLTDWFWLTAVRPSWGARGTVYPEPQQSGLRTGSEFRLRARDWCVLLSATVCLLVRRCSSTIIYLPQIFIETLHFHITVRGRRMWHIYLLSHQLNFLASFDTSIKITIKIKPCTQELHREFTFLRCYFIFSH